MIGVTVRAEEGWPGLTCRVYSRPERPGIIRTDGAKWKPRRAGVLCSQGAPPSLIKRRVPGTGEDELAQKPAGAGPLLSGAEALGDVVGVAPVRVADGDEGRRREGVRYPETFARPLDVEAGGLGRDEAQRGGL